MKVATVIGTRPNIIKTSTLSEKIRKNHEEILIDTGQHYDTTLRDVFFSQLNIPSPKYSLGVGSDTHGVQTGNMMAKLDKIFLMEKPDVVVVYGDTNSTLAGALSAVKMHIPVMHVEAGVRSYDRSMPEEINRVVVDHISNILCCPTPSAYMHLTCEGIGANPSGRFSVTGDIMYDLILKYETPALKTSNIIDILGLDIRKYYLATIHRPSNTDDKSSLQGIIDALGKLGDRVIFPIHPRTREAIVSNNIQLYDNIWIIDPVGYFDMIALTKFAKKVITDSGGLQKEAYFLGTPCVTVRNTTEWEETLFGNWNICAGNETRRILDAVDITTDSERPCLSLFGDGQASYEIVEYINQMERFKSGSNGYN
jgi:UDP-GlcNAc3NAcA epimerase